jgi:hypothetical protein
MKRCPITSVAGLEGAQVRGERTPTGWFFRTARGLSARLKSPDDVVICRVAPGADRDVVQLGCGQTSSALCNAVYNVCKDTAYVFEGDAVRLSPVLRNGRFKGYEVTCRGPLTITALENYMKVHRGLPWFVPMDRKHFPRPPAGWCSWYYYYLKVNEEEVVKNTDWLAENLKQYGCEWVQIDDGWQGRGEGFGSNRDWFVTCERDFPRGMKWCADYIRRKGMRPGLWCIPFTQSDSALFERNRKLFVRREDGSSPGERTTPLSYEWMPPEERRYEWAGRYFIDPTGEEGREYLRRLFRMMCDEWGYEYIKIDAQGMMADFYNQHRRQLADPSLDGARAYRHALETVRSAMGRERFLLNCGAGWTSCGLCDGVRTGGDVSLSWDGIQNAINCTMQWLFLNTFAFYTDPDVVCVREPLPLEQAQLWATLVAVTGQLLMASDKMYELPQERVNLLRRIFPVADIHPMEIYPLRRDEKPAIFDLKVCKPGVGSWDVVALFNWDVSQPRAIELSPARLGLEEGGWICVDGWSGRSYGLSDGHMTVDVPPGACRVIGYWRDLGRPQVVGTTRHITQGAVDLEKVSWDDRRLRLSGVSRVVAGEPYILRIFVPEGFTPVKPDVQWDGRVVLLALEPQAKNRKMSWRVDFRAG